MNKKIATALGAVLTLVVASGCATTTPASDFGETARSVLNKQVHDVEAANNPKLGAVEGGDPYRLDAALEAHRGDVAQPDRVSRPISISIPD